MSTQPVYDFLYVDVKRIARLIAQLDGQGILQETTRELTAGADLGMKFNLFFWQATLAPKSKVSKGGRYDPSWRLPVLFLDEMKHHIVSNPTAWEIGQIVTLTGSIAFRDFAFAGELLKVDAVRAAIESNSTGPEEARDREKLEQFRNAADMLPHLLLAYVTDGMTTTWSTVNDACTTASTGDLILKCGSTIAGSWTITGILDSKPDDGQSPPSDDRGSLAAEFGLFSEAVRRVIGRPLDCYGVTPLTIHRTVEVPKFRGH